jgi:hypothetical protein
LGHFVKLADWDAILFHLVSYVICNATIN